MHETVRSWLPIGAVFLPLVITGVIFLVEQRSWRLRNGLAVGSAISSFLLTLAMYPYVFAGKIVEIGFPGFLPPLGLSFRIDPLSYLLAVVISLIWVVVAIYSLSYMAHEHHKKRYYPFLTLILGGSLGVVMAGDLFTLYLFFEMMSLSSYVMVIHEQTEEAMRAGYKYLILAILGSLCLFFGIISVFQSAQTLTLATGGIIFLDSSGAMIGFFAFMVGFGIKAGMFPFHIWLPDAHPVAPSPASALLSGLMLKTGAYGLIRIIYNVYGIEFLTQTNWLQVLAWLGAASILLGSTVAILQDDIKRRLAYSSIGQMGYILLSMALLSQQALVGAVLHMFVHAFMKAGMFMAAGAVIHKTGRRMISEFAGLGTRMPLTMGSFALLSFSMIGLPPLAGFLSKWQLCVGALAADKPLVVAMLLLSGLMNAIYLLPIVITAFLNHDDTFHKEEQPFLANEADMGMVIPVLFMAAVIGLVGILPNSWPLLLARMSALFLFQLGGY